MDSKDCVERYERAISEAQRYGFKHPRRWMAKHGEVLTFQRSPLVQLRREYSAIRKQINAKIPKVHTGEAETVYRLMR